MLLITTIRPMDVGHYNYSSYGCWSLQLFVLWMLVITTICPMDVGHYNYSSYGCCSLQLFVLWMLLITTIRPMDVVITTIRPMDVVITTICPMDVGHYNYLCAVVSNVRNTCAGPAAIAKNIYIWATVAKSLKRATSSIPRNKFKALRFSLDIS